MRTALLLLALTTVASAQEAERPASIEDSDVLFAVIGQDWEDADAMMPLPDSGAVVGGAGTVWWPVEDGEVAWVRADVQTGRVVQLSIKPGDDVSTENLSQFAQEIKSELGPAGPNGFLDATDWSELVRAGGPLLKPGAKIQVGMFVAERLLVLRLTPGSY